MLCERKRRDFDEYNLIGNCENNMLLHSGCLCLDCMLSLQEFISKQTRDARDRFIDANFPGVPAGVDSPVLV